jgi:hypothetical protein
MAGIVGERGRAKQQKDQDNPHHHRRPTPFFQRLRFCAAAALFSETMFTELAQLAQLAGSFCHFAEVGMSQINGLDGIGS